MSLLGDRSQITIGTSNLKLSYEFYIALGFRVVAKGKDGFSWYKMTDDSLLILLLENGSNYLGFTYFSNHIEDKISLLKGLNVELIQDTPSEKVFFSPHDLIFTISERPNIEDHAHDYQTYLTLEQEAFKDKKRLPNSVLGAFGELACQCHNISEHSKFYTALGFEIKHEAKKPYHWMILSDGLNIIGLHDTNDFTHNNITYFAPDVKETVEHLEDIGIHQITEFTGTGGDENNVVIKTPENQNIFFFKS